MRVQVPPDLLTIGLTTDGSKVLAAAFSALTRTVRVQVPLGSLMGLVLRSYSACGVAWSARHFGIVEDAGSNPATLTIEVWGSWSARLLRRQKNAGSSPATSTPPYGPRAQRSGGWQGRPGCANGRATRLKLGRMGVRFPRWASEREEKRLGRQRQTIGIQTLECCGFKSHLSH